MPMAEIMFNGFYLKTIFVKQDYHPKFQLDNNKTKEQALHRKEACKTTLLVKTNLDPNMIIEDPIYDHYKQNGENIIHALNKGL